MRFPSSVMMWRHVPRSENQAWYSRIPLQRTSASANRNARQAPPPSAVVDRTTSNVHISLVKPSNSYLLPIVFSSLSGGRVAFAIVELSEEESSKLPASSHRIWSHPIHIIPPSLSFQSTVNVYCDITLQGSRSNSILPLHPVMALLL